MKNILFVHSSAELYGSDRSILNIVKNIDKLKYKIFVVLPCPGPLVDEMKKINGVTVEIYKVAVLRRKNMSLNGGIKYIKEFIASSRYLTRFVTAHDIDIVDTNTAVVFPGAIAAKHCKIKSVWHVREIISSYFENRLISFIMNHYSDFIVANSKATGKALHVSHEKIRIVYNAVEEKENTSLIPHKKLIVGMAGRINRWKGQKLLVDAAEIVHKEIPDAIFHIAGDIYKGENQIKNELIEYIAGKKLQDTVILLGQVENMPKFYRNIDLFVLPSVKPEPFGLVVIEAMEFGLPVIATNHGGPVEIISDGIDGYLVDYHNANQMAERIIELLKDDNKRRQMGIKGQNKKRRQFSVSGMVSGIEAIFDECFEA